MANKGMKMDGLYLAVSMDLGCIPLKWLSPFLGVVLARHLCHALGAVN